MMFHRLMWTNFVYYILEIRLYLSLSVNLTSHFSNFADFRQLQIPNARTKYYEIVFAHTQTPHDKTHKIANQYFEFRYHFLTLQKKIPITFEQGCTHNFLSPSFSLSVSRFFLYICMHYGIYSISCNIYNQLKCRWIDERKMSKIDFSIEFEWPWKSFITFILVLDVRYSSIS